MKKPSTVVAGIMFTVAAVIAASTPSAFADGQHKKTTSVQISPEENVFGKEGNPKKVIRTIVVEMNDTMRFGPTELTIKQGETIKFVVKNKGAIEHEMVLGTMEALKAHGEAMRKNPEMEHADPYMARVKPGKDGEMVWQFTKSGEFNYACLVPGHMEAGMIGKINVIKS
jgi:uncharacterized cupredoxin-like copper-binding protein